MEVTHQPSTSLVLRLSQLPPASLYLLFLYTPGGTHLCKGNCARVCAQSYPTPFGPMDSCPPGSSVHGIFPGKNTRGSCHFLLQGIFPIQGSNPRLLHWQGDSLPLYHLGSQRNMKLPGHPGLASVSGDPRNWLVPDPEPILFSHFVASVRGLPHPQKPDPGKHFTQHPGLMQRAPIEV